MKRFPRAILTLLIVIVVALTGCTNKGKNTGNEQKPSPSPTPTTTPTPVFKIDGAPEDLTAYIKSFYAGGDVAISGDIKQPLAARKKIEGIPSGAASVADFKGTPVAAVKVGNDITLLIKGGSGWQTVAGGWPDAGVPGPLLGGKQLILAIGSDARPGEKITDSRGDSLHILGYDGNGGGGILGIARDTWINNAKINAGLYGGPEGQVKVVEQATRGQISLDGYLLTDFDRFIAMVEQVGGLDVQPPAVVLTSKGGVYPNQVNHLNGEKSLAMARERKSLPNGDFDRSANQGVLLQTGGNLLRAKGPLALPGFAEAIGKNVDTNMDAEHLFRFFATPLWVDPAKVVNDVCRGSFSTSADGQSIVLAGAREQGLYADIADGNLG